MPAYAELSLNWREMKTLLSILRAKQGLVGRALGGDVSDARTRSDQNQKHQRKAPGRHVPRRDRLTGGPDSPPDARRERHRRDERTEGTQ
jgi:hypothetical protein